MMADHTRTPDPRVKVTLPDEAQRHAEARERDLGASSQSVLVEALLLADRDHPIPGLGARVAKIEKRLKREREDRGRAALEGARAKRWPEKTSGEGT